VFVKINHVYTLPAAPPPGAGATVTLRSPVRHRPRAGLDGVFEGCCGAAFDGASDDGGSDDGVVPGTGCGGGVDDTMCYAVPPAATSTTDNAVAVMAARRVRRRRAVLAMRS
jgi:hypothetical protein